MSKEHTRECEGDCLFCQMTCPECGEWDGIRVKLNICMDLEIENDTIDSITLDKFIYSDGIEIVCDHCEYTFSDEESDKIKHEIYSITQLDESAFIRTEKMKAA